MLSYNIFVPNSRTIILYQHDYNHLARYIIDTVSYTVFYIVKLLIKSISCLSKRNHEAESNSMLTL